MKLYKIQVRGVVLDWAGTQADAKQATKDHQKEFTDETVKWEEFEFPTDKPNLLAWLKANAVQPGERQVKQ